MYPEINGKLMQTHATVVLLGWTASHQKMYSPSRLWLAMNSHRLAVWLVFPGSRNISIFKTVYAVVFWTSYSYSFGMIFKSSPYRPCYDNSNGRRLIALDLSYLLHSSKDLVFPTSLFLGSTKVDNRALLLLF